MKDVPLTEISGMENKLKLALDNGASLDEKSLGYLCKALERNNQNGFDYLEFKLALHQLEKMEITGELAIKSAFATASAMGVDKGQVLSSIDRYIKVLQQERTDFDSALESAMKRKIEARKKDIATLEQKIADFRKEIAGIEHAIAEGEKRMKSAAEEIESATGELERAEKTFRETYDQVIHSIEKDRELILGIS